MAGDGDSPMEISDRDRVFELEETFASWDSRFYSKASEPLFDRAVSDLLRAMRLSAGESVLDAGCGTGGHAVRAARYGARPVAIDISSTALDQARAQAERAGVLDHITFGQEDLRTLSFDNEAFPHIFSWGVVIHIREIERTLAELVRVLAPGGTLGLWVTNRRALDHVIERWLRVVARKQKKPLVALPLGVGSDYPMLGEVLWTWLFDIEKLVGWLEATHGLKLIHRHIGAFTQLHWMLPGWLQVPVLYMNRGAYRANVPARLGAANMLIFEKPA